MLRYLFTAALVAFPAVLAAQAVPATPEPTPRTASVRVDTDPWLTVWGGGATRTTRDNLKLVDLALESYGTTYERLTPEDRARVRQAHADLLPGQRFSRDRFSEPQARAMVYLALGAWEDSRWGCGSRCSAALDSLGRDAAWIHRTILGLGRAGVRRPRQQELAALHEMADKAHEIAFTTPRCRCADARDDADALLVATREAVHVHEASSIPAWRSLGSERVQRIARLSDVVERALERCGG